MRTWRPGHLARYVMLLPVVATLLGCISPLTPTGDLPAWVHDEWAVGQESVEALIGPEAHTIHPEMFQWEAVDGVFDCGGKRANGCFSPSRRLVRYNTETPSVVRHEAGHAILWKLGRECWRDYEHIDYPYGCKE